MKNIKKSSCNAGRPLKTLKCRFMRTKPKYFEKSLCIRIHRLLDYVIIFKNVNFKHFLEIVHSIQRKTKYGNFAWMENSCSLKMFNYILFAKTSCCTLLSFSLSSPGSEIDRFISRVVTQRANFYISGRKVIYFQWCPAVSKLKGYGRGRKDVNNSRTNEELFKIIPPRAAASRRGAARRGGV